MLAMNLSRRSFLGLAGGTAAAAAGLGLAGCGGGSDSSSSSSTTTEAEPQSGAPATTSLDQLPLPEKGKVYNNPQDRDNIQDGGNLILPASEVGPNWNYCSTEGNTAEMFTYWQYYMPANLVTNDATGSTYQPNPDYLESVESSEDTGKQVITIKVNPQAKFNDGTPIDYRAFQAVWTVMSGKDDRYTPSATDGFDKIESVERGSSDQEVIVTMSEPIYPAELIFTYVIHPSAADPDVFANGWNVNPHAEWGAGPFTIDSVDDTQVTFVPNPNWWGDKPKLDSVTYKQMDAQAVYNAFKNGEVDATGAAQAGSAEMLSNFNSMSDAEIRRAYGTGVACIEINTTRDSLSDIAVRKAFCQCLDPDTLRSIVFQGVNWSEETPGSLLISTWMDGYENNMPDDVSGLSSADDRTAAAKQTLEDAGYSLDSDNFYAKDGSEVSFSFTTFGDSNTTKNRAAAIQKMAKDAGMNVTIDSKTVDQFSSTLTGGEWDTILFSWVATTTSYWFGVQIYGKDSASNYTNTGSEEIDQKFSEVLTVSDHTQQMADFNAAEKEAMKTYAFLPLYAGPDVVVAKKGLANYGPALLQTFVPQNVGWENGTDSE